ncbi:MAG: cyclodeaminase/cyclohydrolase family protein [Desulfobacteraceae bacterium]|nr:cyclodeaminase/cyclohydrolase family protein [Desulfobacteraceae bacterium]
MTLIDLDIKNFTNKVAASSPAPGGGSIAALCGSIGAALCHMVAGLTLGQKKYAAAKPFMLNVKGASESLQKTLLKQVDEDSIAYDHVINAYKLPKATDIEKDLRKRSIQDALKAATLVPFNTLETAASAMALVETVVEKGNPNCITDAGVAAELIAAAVQGAAYNVCINLMDIKDDGFSSQLKHAVLTLKKDIDTKRDHIRKIIEHAINMEP